MSQIYYDELKDTARQVRKKFCLVTPRVKLSDMRSIYKTYDIHVDLWPRKNLPDVKLKGLRGAFFSDSYGCSVLINRNLPEEPRIFTMGHELKHFLKDRELSSQFWCGDDNTKDIIEVGAEIFSAELIFPDQDFKDRFKELFSACTICMPEKLVRLKRETLTTLSYAALTKKAIFLNFAKPDDFNGVKWKKLEEEIYGIPYHRQKRNFI